MTTPFTSATHARTVGVGLAFSAVAAGAAAYAASSGRLGIAVLAGWLSLVILANIVADDVVYRLSGRS